MAPHVTDLLERLPRRAEVCRVPVALGDGLFRVDGTWGTVQPIRLAAGVETIGELELIELRAAGAALIDTRAPDAFAQRTIPGARNVPHGEILDHVDEFDRAQPLVLFCNGPQCKASPDAVRLLLDAGFSAGNLRYYRGGMHDWMTLGFPTAPGR
jgi:rhodanese-related sulfurtransferase